MLQVIFKKILKFIYFDREREREHLCAHKWGRAERWRDRILSRLCTVSAEPDVGLKLMNCEIMTWAEIKSQRLNQLSHPGAQSR